MTREELEILGAGIAVMTAVMTDFADDNGNVSEEVLATISLVGGVGPATCGLMSLGRHLVMAVAEHRNTTPLGLLQEWGWQYADRLYEEEAS